MAFDAPNILKIQEARSMWAAYQLDAALKDCIRKHTALVGEGFPRTQHLDEALYETHILVAQSIKTSMDLYETNKANLIGFLQTRQQEVDVVEFFSRRFQSLDSLYALLQVHLPTIHQYANNRLPSQSAPQMAPASVSHEALPPIPTITVAHPTQTNDGTLNITNIRLSNSGSLHGSHLSQRSFGNGSFGRGRHSGSAKSLPTVGGGTQQTTRRSTIGWA